MEKLKMPALDWRRVLLSPGLLRPLASFFAGFLLSGARILGVHLPAAVCLCATLEPGSAALLCFAGAAAGCLLLWQIETVLLTLACGILTLTCRWAFSDCRASAKPWFPYAITLFPGLLTGLMILLSQPVTVSAVLAFGLQLAFFPAGTYMSGKLWKDPTGLPAAAALFALVSGSGAILLPGGVPLGGILAAGVVFSLCDTVLALPAAALAGLALDWSIPGGTSCTAVLTIAALAAGALSGRRRGFAAAAYLLSSAVVLVLAGGAGGRLYPAVVLGCGIAMLLPPFPTRSRELAPPELSRKHICRAASALDGVCCQLEDAPVTNRSMEVSDIFDKATGRVCIACAGFSACWKRGRDRTRSTFLAASAEIFRRGMAYPEDFSPEFRQSCRHISRLCTEITEAIARDMERKQRLAYRRELRTLLAGQYRVLADYLRTGLGQKKPPRPAVFRADAACQMKSCRPGGVSGDRCDSFRVGERQYLVLCDGMGTGVEAAVCSRQALDLVTDLLKAGMEPEGVLETLGTLAILREDGGFCTVDLAWVSLITGEGVLYKWGGGPAYVKKGETVKKVGTAMLPPGVGVGGTHQAQRIRLSLGRGEMLILTSDGVDGEDVLHLIRAAEGLRAESLAAGILRCRTDQGEDDKSAAVLQLYALSS